VGVIKQIGILLRALLANRAALAMENLALRQQLAVLERSVKRLPRDNLLRNSRRRSLIEPARRRVSRTVTSITLKDRHDRTDYNQGV
jgi:hypothetical protein